MLTSLTKYAWLGVAALAIGWLPQQAEARPHGRGGYDRGYSGDRGYYDRGHYDRGGRSGFSFNLNFGDRDYYRPSYGYGRFYNGRGYVFDRPYFNRYEYAPRIRYYDAPSYYYRSSDRYYGDGGYDGGYYSRPRYYRGSSNYYYCR